jgi:hypothetical protein
MHLSAQGSPGHTARLAAAAGVALPGQGRRVLAFHAAPPTAKDPLLSSARAHAAPLHARPAALGGTSTGASTNKTRKIATTPERVLDAPGMLDDYYLNVLDWSVKNVLAVALAETTYVWRADSGEVAPLAEAPEGAFVSSVKFSADGGFLGVGLGTGDVELWDVTAGKRLRNMGGHQAQVATLSWNGHVLTSGCHDGSIWHHDVRVAKHKVQELLGLWSLMARRRRASCERRQRQRGEHLGCPDECGWCYDDAQVDEEESYCGSQGDRSYSLPMEFEQVLIMSTLYLGNCMVSLAAVPPRFRRRYQRRFH